MEMPYKKNKGNAGLCGVEFQVNLVTIILLNALRKLRSWKMSSENTEAAKFDDIVLELADDSALLFQAKFKESRKITKEQLLSTNSKNADFSLPKYFFSHCQVKTTFKVEAVVICTNTDIDEKGLENVLTRQNINCESMLYYEGGSSSYVKFSEDILPDLKASAHIYHKNNLQGKDIDQSIITDDNLRQFLENLQVVINYPSGENLNKVIQQLLTDLKGYELAAKISPEEIYKKVEGWFKQKRGEYLTEVRAAAMFSEIRSDRYCKILNDYDVSFERNDFKFVDSTKVFHVNSEGEYLLPALKIYDALQNDRSNKLYVNPDEDVEIQKQVIQAFELKRYKFLIIIWFEPESESTIKDISDTLTMILGQHQHKKIILVGDSNNKLVQQVREDNDVLDVEGSVKFDAFSDDTQKRLMKSKHIVFQGRQIALEELLAEKPVEQYAEALNSEILQKLVREEEIKVGAPVLDLDEDTARYYISRTFKRIINKINEEVTHSSLDEDPLSNTDGYKTPKFKKRGYSEEDEDSVEDTKDILPEESIYDVEEKVTLIADMAGMGKSTVLAKLGMTIKEKHPHLWVLRIELNEYTGILKDSIKRNIASINIKELLNSKEETKLANSLEEFVFSMNKKVILMLDGVDEISPHYKSLVFGLLSWCQRGANFAKIFVTTRPHLAQELEKDLDVKPFILNCFTEQNKIDFLTSYWVHNLKLTDAASKHKCEHYVKVLLNKLHSWTESTLEEKNYISAIPLQMRMLAEIFQESNQPEDSTNWEGCKEYVTQNYSEPNLPEQVNIAKLYDMFIEKRRDIFVEKGNPSGNAAATQALMEQFDECLVYHRRLASELLIGNLYVLYPELFPECKDMETNALKTGIVQRLDNKFSFIHRTVGEYFFAEYLFKEFQYNENMEVRVAAIHVIVMILCSGDCDVIRAFLDSFLRKILDSFPCYIFKNYQLRLRSPDPSLCIMSLQLLHILAERGSLQTLKFILKCVDFKIISHKESSIGELTSKNILKRASKHLIDKIRGTDGIYLLDGLKYLVRKGGVNIKNEEGETPLHVAVRNDCLEMAQFLVENGANVDIINNQGLNTLHIAVQAGHLDIIEYLVNLIGDSGVIDRKALHLAAEKGHLHVIKYMIEKFDVDVNVKSSEGYVALHWAAFEGHLDVVSYLVEVGADLNIRDNRGMTTFHFAAFGNQLDMLKFLKDFNVDINTRDYNNFTVLHTAASKSQLDTIQFLVEIGVDASVKSWEGTTALHLAACFGRLYIVKYLVDITKDLNVKTHVGRTPLHFAAFQGHFDVVKFLVDFGANIDALTENGNTALDFAKDQGHSHVSRFLVKHGAITGCQMFCMLI